MSESTYPLVFNDGKQVEAEHMQLQPACTSVYGPSLLTRLAPLLPTAAAKLTWPVQDMHNDRSLGALQYQTRLHYAGISQRSRQHIPHNHLSQFPDASV